ncbi:MAG: L,D-transpeptidase [Deltaproteobacteria bacterium]|nr:L,D-transpeptidase [Deltaproteobacteria bacterium]
MTSWTAEFEGLGPLHIEQTSARYPYFVMASRFSAPIYDTYRRGREIVGGMWRGGTKSGRRVRTKETCQRGQGRWYKLRGGGYVCNRVGFTVSRAKPRLVTRQRDPAVEAPLPFRYARVIDKGALRLNRLPTRTELRTLDARRWTKGNAPKIVAEEMFGDFFLSIDQERKHLGRRYYRTVRGQYVRAEAIQLRDPPPMLGVRLTRDDANAQDSAESGPYDSGSDLAITDLPVAFTYGEEERFVFCRSADDALERCGTADKHARFSVRGALTIDGDRYVRGQPGWLVKREAVRIARAIDPPAKIKGDMRWVHIDLSEQTLVAYEGDTPVYATLISSGKPGRDTPTGLYRIERKYLTRTMRGQDEVDGVYHVEDVPWTMYYRGAYAVHGAYWHNVFGQTRSHGCTNLAPADARWLYHFTSPRVPKGWHSVQEAVGTYVYFTQRDDG